MACKFQQGPAWEEPSGSSLAALPSRCCGLYHCSPRRHQAAVRVGIGLKMLARGPVSGQYISIVVKGIGIEI